MERKMILQQERTVRLSETDATGIIYFTNLFKYACESFEEYLENELKRGGHTFHTTNIALPIVDVKGVFLSQITTGDKVSISLEKLEKKRTSLIATTTIKKGETIVAKITIVHVAISKLTGKKILLKDCESLVQQSACL